MALSRPAAADVVEGLVTTTADAVGDADDDFLPAACVPVLPAEVLLPAGVLSLLLPQAARPSAAAATTAATLVA